MSDNRETPSVHERMGVNDEIREQRAKLKGKGFKYKFAYFWEYYRWATLGVIVGIGFFIALIKTFVDAKDTAFQAVFINSQAAIPVEEFAELIGINTSKEEVLFDASYRLNLDPEGYDENSYVSMQKILAMTTAHELDVILGYENIAEYYGKGDMLLDLRELFGEQYINDLGDKVMWVDIERTDDNNNSYIANVPVAIDVTDAKKLIENQCFPYGNAYFTVVANSRDLDRVKQFFEYIYK